MDAAVGAALVLIDLVQTAHCAIFQAGSRRWAGRFGSECGSRGPMDP